MQAFQAGATTSTTITAGQLGIGQNVFTLPAATWPDQSVVPCPFDTVISNQGPSLVWLAFGAGAKVGPNVAGQLTVLPGQDVLLTTNASKLSRLAGNALVTSTQAANAQTATSVSAATPYGQATVTIEVGVATTARSWKV